MGMEGAVMLMPLEGNRQIELKHSVNPALVSPKGSKQRSWFDLPSDY